MKENLNIDELLNGFIDGELSQRHQTEVQRLVAHDPEVAERLRQLQRCKMLVCSLPRAEAPTVMTEDIKTALERKTLLGQRPEHLENQQGARQLFIRKVLTAAAMIGLVAVLGGVIYSIIAPEGTPYGPVAVETEPIQTAPVIMAVNAEKPGTADDVVAMTGFEGRLELAAGNFAVADEFIRTVLESHGLPGGATGPMSHDGKSIRSITCSRKNLNLVLADMGKGWDKFDSAKLFVNSVQPDGKVTVEKVTAQQIAEIIGHSDYEKRIKVAKYFAVINNVAGRLPGKETMVIRDQKTDLVTIPKPVLTSSQKTTHTPDDKSKDQQKMQLTIVLVSGE